MAGSSRHRVRRCALALALACPGVAILAPAAASAASTTAVTGGVLTYTATGPGANSLSISYSYGYYVLTDPGGGTLGPGAGCQQISTHQVRCALTGVKSVSVDLGDGNDSFSSFLAVTPTTVHGGRGNDVLTGGAAPESLFGDDGADTLDGGYGNDALDGGAGIDALKGGAGEDKIAAQDGEADTVTCGSEADAVSADASDSVASDCETVNGSLMAGGGATPPPPPTDPGAGTGTSTGTGTTTGTTTPTESDPVVGPNGDGHSLTDPPAVTITQRAATATSHGVVGIAVGCPADASGGCTGSIRLGLPVVKHARKLELTAARRRKIIRRISRGRHFKIAAGRKLTVRVRLTGPARKMLCRRRKLSVKAIVSLSQPNGKTATSTDTIQLRAARRRAPSRC